MKNLTKSKTAMSLLLIGLAAIIIGGATMAWFTGEDTIDAATFTAGTVVVNADKADPFIVQPEGKYFDNVNPGDCARVNWNIVNEGTKAVELRVKLDYEWSGVEGAEVDPFYFCPPEGSPWVLYEEDTDADGVDETWLYYTGGPVRGTYNPDGEALEPASVPLTLVVGFDGEEMGNEYQGASLTLGSEGSKVEAIQASNGAPEAVWGDAFTEANADDYDFLNLRGANYFYEGLGNDMPCWGGEDDDDDDDEIVVGSFEIKDIGASKSERFLDYYTTVNGTIFNLKDTNGNPISGSQLANIEAIVDALLDDGSKTEQINITFDSNGEGYFEIIVPGVWTDTDNTVTVTVTIGGVEVTAYGD